jgi:hypothetical protein
VRVVDDASQAVRNATVLALNQGQSSRIAYDNSAARTGKYVVSNLDPGVYRIAAFAPGFIQEFDFNAPASSQPLYRSGDSVTLRLTRGGVVTGRVADADGSPVVGARVTAVRVRDLLGRPAQDNAFEAFRPRERRTDDRGVYRLYGLTPGSYVVLTGGKPQFNFSARPTAYDTDAPTYYPSTTRDGAVELQVQTGQELTDIDIRYRGDKGHSVGGAVVGALAANQSGPVAAIITLVHTASGSLEGTTFIQGDANPRTFSFDSVADGEYDLIASSFVQNDTGVSSPPVHVSVRGADVAGLRLALVPLGSLAGRVGFEPLKPPDAAKPECQKQRAFVPQETLIFARRDAGTEPAQPRNFFQSSGAEAPPDAKGDFTLRNLRDGRYRLGARLLDESLYLRAVSLPAAAPPASAAARAALPATATDPARGFSLKPGERLAGALVQISAGAASLRGRVAAGEGEQLPDSLRVHLVPAERERAEDVLRYAEADAQPDGAFTFKNLSPGRYLLVARPAPPEPDPRQPARPLALDTGARAALRRDAEAAKNSVELQPCQRAEDFTLRFTRQ